MILEAREKGRTRSPEYQELKWGRKACRSKSWYFQEYIWIVKLDN